MATPYDSVPTKAELAAKARAEKRAAQEAEALRKNLLRRKTQARARETGEAEKCP